MVHTHKKDIPKTKCLAEKAVFPLSSYSGIGGSSDEQNGAIERATKMRCAAAQRQNIQNQSYTIAPLLAWLWLKLHLVRVSCPPLAMLIEGPPLEGSSDLRRLPCARLRRPRLGEAKPSNLRFPSRIAKRTRSNRPWQ